MSTVKAADINVKTVTISPPNLVTALFHIVGEDNTDYCQHKFSAKAQRLIREKQEAGSTAKKGAKREARDFAQDCKDATYLSKEGWYGIPAPA